MKLSGLTLLGGRWLHVYFSPPVWSSALRSPLHSEQKGAVLLQPGAVDQLCLTPWPPAPVCVFSESHCPLLCPHLSLCCLCPSAYKRTKSLHILGPPLSVIHSLPATIHSLFLLSHAQSRFHLRPPLLLLTVTPCAGPSCVLPQCTHQRENY